MNRPNPAVDKFGFPIPSTFEQTAARDRGDKAASRGRGAPRLWRWAMLGLGVAMLGALLYKTPFGAGGRELMADWLRREAVQRYLADDTHGALRLLDRSLAWKPGQADVLEFRARLRLQSGDLEGSLQDFNLLVQQNQSDPELFMGRSQAHQRLGDHRRAIDDMNQAVELTQGTDASALNGRAYARALANLELDAGLVDVEQALERLRGQQHFMPDEEYDQRRAAYLDTRGYLLYLLGRQPEALADMDEALEIAQRHYDRLRDQQSRLRGSEHRRTLRMMLRMSEENLAVMYHHRGQIHEALENRDQAELDLARGDELGYNPADGVY